MSEAVDKQSQRAVIYFLTKECVPAGEIHRRMEGVYGEHSLKMSAVYKWATRFGEGRTSVSDDDREGRPSTAHNEKVLELLKAIIEENPRVTVEEMCVRTCLSHGSVVSCMRSLNLTKVSCRWTPHHLSDEQKEKRVRCSQATLLQIGQLKNGFWERLVTSDETWLPYFMPENKTQSKQWIQRDDDPPVKAKPNHFEKKVMLTTFWDADGIIWSDFMPDNATITAEYYCTLLTTVHEKIRRKRPGKRSKGILFLHDNARPHTAHRTRSHLKSLKWMVLEHPPYSPDLAPSDYALFGKIKKPLRGIRYRCREELIGAAKKSLKETTPEFCNIAIRKLEGRLQKCVAGGGNYTEQCKLEEGCDYTCQ
jgi:histone-lysine N-methyltransferase SETMAR